MRKVYIVTAGIYSDYHIEQVFSTKEQAQIYLDHIGNADSANIEEYNVDVETPRGVFGYRVTIQDDSSNTEVCLCDFDKSPFWCKDVFSGRMKHYLCKKEGLFGSMLKQKMHHTP